MARRRRYGDDDDIGADIDAYSPGSGGKKKKRKPLGVPEDYTRTVDEGEMLGRTPAQLGRAAREGRTVGQKVSRGPRYFDGDEWKPASMSPAAIAELQRDMAAAGLIEPGARLRLGSWDETSMKAYKELLSFANATGLPHELALNRYAKGIDIGERAGGGGRGGRGGGGGAGGGWYIDENGEIAFEEEEQYVPPPLEIRTTSKDDLRRVFRSSIIEQLGQGWTQAQINELVDAYAWKEIQTQTDAYNAQVAIERADFMGERTEGGETISQVEVPSPQGFVEEELRRRDPTGYAAGQLVNEYLPLFFESLRGWV